jgi:hypothetical protein
MDAEKLSKKQKKNVPVATAEKPIEQASSDIPRSVNAADGKNSTSIEQTSKIDEKPLTSEERLARLEVWMAQADKNFSEVGAFLTKLEPLIKLSNDVAARQSQNPQGQPQAQGGLDISQIIGLIEKYGGGGSNPMQDKINELSIKILDNALAKATTPSKFEAFFEEELARSKAKAMAVAALTP